MAKKKIDRRVKYTKTVLKKTLIQLMTEHHISKISVKQICEVADVNRSTFYAHYDNQYDLLRHIEQETIKDINEFIFKEASRQVTVHGMFCLMLEYAAHNAQLFRILLNDRSGTSFRNELIEFVKELALVETYTGYKANPHIIEYIQLFAISGYFSVIDKWLEDGMIEPITELADLLLILLRPNGEIPTIHRHAR